MRDGGARMVRKSMARRPFQFYRRVSHLEPAQEEWIAPPGGIVGFAASGAAFDKSKNLWVVVNYDEVDELKETYQLIFGLNDRKPLPCQKRSE
jgi:hypothetical protein